MMWVFTFGVDSVASLPTPVVEVRLEIKEGREQCDLLSAKVIRHLMWNINHDVKSLPSTRE